MHTKQEEPRGRQYDLGLAWVHFLEGRAGSDLPPPTRSTSTPARQVSAPPIGIRHFFGLAMAGPALVTHGSDEIQDRLLRRMFSGEDARCQLFRRSPSRLRPGRARHPAVRDGDEWVVSGQKVWNTFAHLADRGMLVARSDPEAPKHKGLTYFALDMHLPGVDVRPLRQITGEAELSRSTSPRCVSPTPTGSALSARVGGCR